MIAPEPVRLADCCEIVAGATPSTNVDSYWGGPIAWATPKDLSDLDGKYLTSTPDTLTEEGYRSCSAKLMPAGSVLFSSRAPIGHVAINSVPMCTNQGFKSFVPDPKRLSADYLYHWLRANKAYLQSLGNGATFKEVSKAVVSEVTIPLPPLPEQRRIAAILDKADALRAKRREAIAKLDQLMQSVFLDMFGDPVTNPKGWPLHAVADLCEKVTVGIVVRPASHYVDNGVPAIRSLNIGVNKIIEDDFVYFSNSSNDGALAKTRLKHKDVVIVRSGQPGKAAVVPKHLDGANAIDVLIARTKPSELLPEFLTQFLNSNAGKRLVLSEQRGQVQKHLNVAQLSAAPLPLPPIALQTRFLELAEEIELNVAYSRKSSERLEELFSSIQSQAFATIA